MYLISKHKEVYMTTHTRKVIRKHRNMQRSNKLKKVLSFVAGYVVFCAVLMVLLDMILTANGI